MAIHPPIYPPCISQLGYDMLIAGMHVEKGKALLPIASKNNYFIKVYMYNLFFTGILLLEQFRGFDEILVTFSSRLKLSRARSLTM